MMPLRNSHSSCQNWRSLRAAACLMLGLLAVLVTGCLAPEAPHTTGDAGAADDASPSDIQITLESISGLWTLEQVGEPVRGRDVTLRLNGPLLAKAKGIRFTLEEATDATGNKLNRRDNIVVNLPKLHPENSFHPLNKYEGLNFETKAGDKFFDKPAGLSQEVFGLQTPDDLKTIKSLKGYIELIVPSADPASTITASFAKDPGKPLEHAALKAAGVTVTLQEPSDDPTDSPDLYEFKFKLDDPQNNVGGFEFLNAKGEKQLGLGRGIEGDGELYITGELRQNPPKDALLKIYLVSSKSIVKVPFELKDLQIQ